MVAITPSPVGIALSILGVALGLVVLQRDVRALRKRWAAYHFSRVVAPFPQEDIPPPSAYPEAEYTYYPERGTVLTSPVVDEALQTGSFTITVLEEQYQLPPRLKELAPYVLSTINRGKVVFNGPFLGLVDDPIPQAARPDLPLHVQKARYFDGQCSNEICILRATYRETGREIDLRRQELRSSRTGRLKTLAESDLANGIGISTLAFTTDDHLVVVPQTRANNASAQLLAPSGSGSLEPCDVPSLDERHGLVSLQEVVAAGMTRELREETGLRTPEISGTRVLGFARWLERGARPEFFGHTQLNVSSIDITRRRLSGGESLYAGSFELHPVSLSALGQELADGGSILRTAHVPQKLLETGALPLLVALRVCALWRHISASAA